MTSFAHDSAHLAETCDRVSDQQFESDQRLALHGRRTGHERGVEFAEVSAFGTFVAAAPAELQPALRTELISALDAHRGAHRLVMRGWEVTLVAQQP